MLTQKMDKLRQNLTVLPPWVFTAIVFAAILWLTLVPHPLGDDEPELFPGADKVAHGLMFGGLTLVVLLDYRRKHDWRPLRIGFIWGVALMSALIGVTIEYLQRWMELGRGFEVTDMIADAAGSALFALSWQIFQSRWTQGVR